MGPTEPRQPSRRGCLVAAALLLLGARIAAAHPLAPALLELRELGGGRIAVTWKTSALRAPGIELTPVLPRDCRTEGVPRSELVADAVVATWTVRCPAATLVGASIGIDGLAAARVDALLRLVLVDGRTIRTVLRADAARLTVPAREQRADVASAYAALGFRDGLAGLDHLLFVAGLLLLVRAGWPLAETIGAFAVGHSLTLTLSVLGVVALPTAPIELAIALSVFVLAGELARESTSRLSFSRRRPWVIAFAFGLLHGLGFASELRAVGLPEGDLPLALLSFNVGIELAQLTFVVAALSLARLARRLRFTWPRWAAQVPLYVMGSLAAFWCFERAAALVQ